MAILEILEIPDPRLRIIAKPVTVFDADLLRLIEDMIQTMHEANGIGLAATQVDVHRRLLVLDVSESQDQPRVYINPEIVDAQGSETCEEGCLSVPGIYAEVSRAAKSAWSVAEADARVRVRAEMMIKRWRKVENRD